MASQFDHTMMQRCLDLARQAAGQTAPNPMVGAVVVQEGQIVGEGFHPGAGQPHAEVFALRAAGDRARGATVYVSLEPCNHYGRTPPCSEALIQAGVARVVAGMVDPDPRVSGGGLRRLQEAGIAVEVGVEEEACRALNEAFIHRVLHQQPFGILKYAMTLDGKIATTTGHSAWVTSPTSRTEVHRLRMTCDAIIVGGNTVRRDNPLLTTHGLSSHTPLRVIMTRTLDLPHEAKVWDTRVAPTLVFTEPGKNTDLQAMLQSQGVGVIEIPCLSPKMVMQHLFETGCSTVLWECGGTLAAQAIADGTVQKILAFIAPKIIGGDAAPSPIGDLGFSQMTEALLLEQISWRSLGSDLLLEGYLPISTENRYP